MARRILRKTVESKEEEQNLLSKKRSEKHQQRNLSVEKSRGNRRTSKQVCGVRDKRKEATGDDSESVESCDGKRDYTKNTSCRTRKRRSSSNDSSHKTKKRNVRESSTDSSSDDDTSSKRKKKSHLPMVTMYQCLSCDKQFIYKGNWVKHSRRCEKKTKNKESEKEKSKNKSSVQKSYSCKECGKVFVHNFTLQGHMNIHAQKYRCKPCNRCFASQVLLDNHVAFHKVPDSDGYSSSEDSEEEKKRKKRNQKGKNLKKRVKRSQESRGSTRILVINAESFF